MAEILLVIDSYSKPLIFIGVMADLLSNFPDEKRVWNLVGRYCPPLFLLALLDIAILAGAIQLSAEAMLAKFFIFVYFLYLNWDRLGLNFFIAGMALNNLVMAANGGQMPVVYEEGAEELKRLFISESTKLNFLADYIYARGFYMSVGDCCMFIGVLVFAVWQTAVMIDLRRVRVKN
jgi:hypothetical protein